MTTASEHAPWLQEAPTGRLLRPSDVSEITGLSKSQIYQMIAEGRFPPFLKLSTRVSAMPEAWLTAFIEARASQTVHMWNKIDSKGERHV